MLKLTHHFEDILVSQSDGYSIEETNQMQQNQGTQKWHKIKITQKY